MRPTDQERVDRLLQIFSKKKIESETHALRTEAGREFEIRLSPTEDLIAAALVVGEHGFKLHYDGRNVRVIQLLEGQLPEEQVDEVVDEQGSLIGTKARIASVDDSLITGSATEYALIHGLRPQDLVEEKIGTGADGRITRSDVQTYVQSRVT